MHNATPLLRTALEPLVRRHRQLRLLGWLAMAFGAIGLLGVLFLPSAILLVAAAVAGAWGSWVAATNWQPDYGAIARQIEERHPDLQHLLRTAVEQAPDTETKKLNYLQLRVVAEAAAACQRSEILESVPQSRIAGAWTALAGASALLIFALFSLPSEASSQKAVAAAEKKGDAVEVTPGDTSIERGSGLVVLAKFNQDVPTEAVLVVSKAGQSLERINLVKNLSDPVYGGGITEIDTGLTYRVEYAGKQSRDFIVTVFEHPRLDRADAHLKFPDYTGQPEKDIPDTRRVSAVVGSTLDVQFHLNKPVRRAHLVEKDGTDLPLVIDPAKPLVELKGYQIQTSGKYVLQLEDSEGRTNKIPANFSIEARPNRRPEVKLVEPKHDLRVSPIEEVAFRGEVWDDFGVSAAGFAYAIAKETPIEVKLSGQTKADARVTLDYQLKFEELGVKQDQLVSWYFWADDIGPDGKTRRTVSDMFFAEVRPFEEIFRQAEGGESEQQQQQRQQSAQGQQAQQQAAKEKEILTATWNLQRAEEDAVKPSEKYLQDIVTVRDSQAEVLEKTRGLTEKLEDEKSRAFAETAVREMEQALDLLKSAATDKKPLPEAVRAERGAYDAMLKLAAHEYQVSKQNSRQQQNRNQAQNQPGMQQQLDQLELKEDKQRYETQREAETPEKEEQREQLAVLNRLKELAQRQEDINSRVKELQSALQEAKTEKEKEELKRQLQRLREEQQEQLAELDALKEKTEEPKNQARFAEERAKLEQTRQEAQKAAESMQKGEASQALASGARTERDLKEMRDEVRRKSSQQFNDEMRQMRTDARQLADKQKEVSEKLTADAAKPQRRTLDGSGDLEQATKDLAKQKENFQKLTEDMKRVSEQAEGAEPLLAKELYDTLRKSAQSDTSRTLDQTQQLTQRGLAQEAQRFEEKARGEIEEVKEGVERAAEKVLGNEAEALKKARAELDRLSKDLDREIARKAGEPPQEGEQSPDAQGQEGERNGNRTANNRSRNDQNGEPREGEQNGARNPSAQSREGNEDPNGERPPNERGQARQPGEREGQQPGQRSGERNGERNGQGERQPRPGQPNQDPQGNGEQEKNGEGQPRPGELAGAQPREGAQPGQRPGAQNSRNPQNGERQPGERQPGEQNAEQGEPREGEGQQPGAQPANQPGQQGGRQPGQNRPGQAGRQPGEQGEPREGEGQQTGAQPGNQPGRQGERQPGGQNRSGQAGQQPGERQPGQGQQAGEAQQPGEGQGEGAQTGQSQGNSRGSQAGNRQGQPGQRGQRAGENRNSPGNREQANRERQPGDPRIDPRNTSRRGGNDANGTGGGPLDFEESGPITGERFVDWSDRLRSVEEMLDDQAMRTEAARIREIAKGVRSEFKRHSVEPKWDIVRSQIHQPLAELRNRVSNEIARKDNKEALVPIDRDPVPAKFTEQVRKYYEDLGK